jgi:hypothetical protein
MRALQLAAAALTLRWTEARCPDSTGVKLAVVAPLRQDNSRHYGTVVVDAARVLTAA